MACLGSSSTAGKGQAFNWIRELQRRLGERRVTFRNFGVCFALFPCFDHIFLPYFFLRHRCRQSPVTISLALNSPIQPAATPTTATVTVADSAGPIRFGMVDILDGTQKVQTLQLVSTEDGPLPVCQPSREDGRAMGRGTHRRKDDGVRVAEAGEGRICIAEKDAGFSN